MIKDRLKHNLNYWFFQLLGWGTYVFIVGLVLYEKSGLSNVLLSFLASILGFNLLVSHGYRLLIKRNEWLQGNTFVLIIKILIACIFLGGLFSFSTNVFSYLFTNNYDSWMDVNSFLTGFLLYFIWSALYFVSTYFLKARAEQLKNLKLESLKNEIELQNLRSQLNPHFMFNAMNSIRALVDENPKQAKQSITQLSNILRNALIHGKDSTISVKDELAIVDDYLSLEKIRFEERLTIERNISSSSLNCKIPPLLLQTLVENAIKHGIAKLMQGGVIRINIDVVNDNLILKISNSGTYVPNKIEGTGVGIENTKKRLSLEYGEKATFSIKNSKENEVETKVIIPLKN